MKNVKTKTVIPDYVVRDEDKKQFTEKFVSEFSRFKESWKQILQMKDLEIPDDPKKLSVDDVNTFVEERIADVMAAKMLTYDGRERAKKEWLNIRSNAISLINDILGFFGHYPDAEVMVTGDVIVCTNTDTIVYEHCKLETPQAVYEHIAHIEAVKDAIMELTEFEKKHQYPTGDLVNVFIDIDMLKEPEKLILNWLWQEERRAILNKHEYMKAGMEMQARKDRAKHQEYLNGLVEKYAAEHPEDNSQKL
ncbi:MAG: hypothetical protein J6Q22_08780 [Prevotella sp.]|nr:hypothetical protein [Prevotella sp.]